MVDALPGRLYESSGFEESKLLSLEFDPPSPPPQKKLLACQGTSSSLRRVFVQFDEAKHIHLPTELYGRDEELARLEQVQAQEWVLLSGPSGCGKTALARRYRPAPNAYLVTAHFSTTRAGPYAALVSAFTDFTHQVLARGQQARIRAAVLEAVGSEVPVLTNMIPALREILGETTGASTKGVDALQRFVFVFRMFLRSIEEPLVILLDDVDQADPCSLDLLSAILTDTSNERQPFLIGTCSDHVPTDSYLSIRLRDLEERNVKITHIALREVPPSVLRRLLAETYGRHKSECDSLARLLGDRSGGNFFHVTELLRWMQVSDLLTYNSTMKQWEWDIEEVELALGNRKGTEEALSYHDMDRLPLPIRDVLKVAACLGTRPDKDLLKLVVDVPVPEILEHCVNIGLLGKDTSGFFFEHEAIRKFIYEAIPDQDRDLFHLEIGRRMWRKMSCEQVDRYSFDLLGQLMAGKRLISRENEKQAVSTLCLHSAHKAARSSSFRTAEKYVSFGLSLLHVRSWRDSYELTLALHHIAAEIEVSIGTQERLDYLLDQIFENARTFDDKFQAHCTQIYADSSGREQQSLDHAIEVLEELGMRLPRRPSVPKLMVELLRVRRMMRGRTDESILRLPSMTNPKHIQAMQILQLTVLASMLARPLLTPFIILKMTALTIESGLSVFAPGAMSTYGMLFVIVHRDFPTAERFGRLGLRLLERADALEYLPRVYAAYYGVIQSWTHEAKHAADPLLKAYRTGLMTGDVEFSALCRNMYFSVAMHSGKPLDALEREVYNTDMLNVSRRENTLSRMAICVLQEIHHITGQSPDPLSKNGDLLNYEEERRLASESGVAAVVATVAFLRMNVLFLFDRLDLLEDELDILMARVDHIPPTFELITHVTVCSLVALGLARLNRKRRQHIRFAKRMLRRYLRPWAVSTPLNALDKLNIVEAEFASFQGKKEAFQYYVAAMRVSAECSMMHSVACERTARHFARLRQNEAALEYLVKAKDSFEQWGAKAKVRLLQEELRICEVTAR